MPVVEQGTRPGDPDDGMEVIPTDDGFAAAWLDGSCGAGGCSCLAWMQWAPSGVTTGNLDLGATTCALADDRGSTLGWIDVADPAAPTLASLTSWPPASTIPLGATDEGVLGVPVVHGAAGDLQALGLAVEPELGELELRWVTTGPTVGSTRAGPLDGADPFSADLAAVGDDLAALWTVPGSGPGAYLRRWSLDGSGPVPLETAPVELALGPGITSSHLLPSPEPGRLAIVSMAGYALEVRTFPFPGEVPEEPDAPALDVTVGGSIADTASDPDHGLLVLLVVPVAGTPDCVTALVLLDPARAWSPVQLATWGAEGGLGCQARLALVSADRFAVAWKTPMSGEDGFALQWTLGALETGF
jgi:hypothetical protein